MPGLIVAVDLEELDLRFISFLVLLMMFSLLILIHIDSKQLYLDAARLDIT